MNAMRPGLPDPLIDLLGARWAMDAPPVGAVWCGGHAAAAFGLADGTIAIARTPWDGAATVRPREGGGMELVPASEAAPPVMRVGAHEGACLAVAADATGGILSGGADGRLALTAADGSVTTVASFSGQRIEHVASPGLGGMRACATGNRVTWFGPAADRRDLAHRVTALAFNDSGDTLAIGHQDGVTLWHSGAARMQVLSAPGLHRSLAWSPDGRLLTAAGAARTGFAWQAPFDAAIALEQPQGFVISPSYSAPGGFLATGGGRRVTCWRLQGDGAAAATECGIGIAAGVSRVACHPRRSIIAAGAQNGTVLLCQPGGDDILFVRGAGEGAVTALAWSDDGAFLALATAEGEIGVVAIPEQLFRAAPATAEMGITQ